MSFLTQKLIWSRIKLLLPNEKFSWPRYTMRILKKNGVFSDDFGLRSPIVQKPFFRPKTARYLYRSTRRLLSLPKTKQPFSFMVVIASILSRKYS